MAVFVCVGDQEGKSAIYCAVEKGYTEIAKLLLKSNPDLELSTKVHHLFIHTIYIFIHA